LYSNGIGNQALLRASDNADLRSIGFAEKKKIYAQSPYVLTNQIAEATVWSVAAIVQRQKTLADVALRLGRFRSAPILDFAAGDIDHQLGKLGWVAGALYAGRGFRHRDSSDEE
jgi:hypothetical protein